MKDIWIIFDDTIAKRETIRDIIGEKGFSNVVVKKKRLESYYAEVLCGLYPQAEWRTIHAFSEFYELLEEAETKFSRDCRVLHCFSNYIISDKEKAALTFKKLPYIDDDYRVLCGTKPAALMFSSLDSYVAYLRQVCAETDSVETARKTGDSCLIEGLVDIGDIGNFVQCVSGNFDSRFFNTLTGDEYTLVKTSENRKKIKSEYTYYQLLPEDMKFWFVQPFHYQDNGKEASYIMEWLHMTDLSVKWVHGSIDETEFGELMDKYFYFFRCRHSREVSGETYRKQAASLYTDKVTERIAQLKSLPEYGKIVDFLSCGCEEGSIDALVEKYFRLKQAIEKKNKYPCIAVIGHGDPCFSNTLYNRATKTMKFIDPKGALTEEELWTNPYYDIAKLSHSVCGCYDFFNNGLFDIWVDEGLSCRLKIDFDNSRYVEIFRKKLEENHYDYRTVRLYEASLFLSMLPLHIDYPQKVLGFILNAKNILEEIEKN